MTYQDTSLWKRTLGLEDENVKPFRENFWEARKNAEYLLAKIRDDFPNLTVHDISHVDSLWIIADTIIGEAYPINPLEGYILGIAFLIHDAALSYDAVGGKEQLRKTVQWRDAYADGPGDTKKEEYEKECDFSAIRTLHAQYAADILSKKFLRNNTTSFYIIDDDDYRKHYGELIGKIAASHHWEIADIESLPKQKNPRSGMPKNWVINGQKLACILRCADAGHIDDGRAPDKLFHSLSVNGVSLEHWESQNHLCQVIEDEDDETRLCITSCDPFEKKEFAAWNVAFEAIQLFDRELKSSNHLLKSISTPKTGNLEFPHKEISGASSKESLAHYVETKDWTPCSIGVHTSKIKALIESLGGCHLYGEENQLVVVLRELIQNARDAIQARNCIDKSFKDGKITVRHLIEGDQHFIEIEDNGIGMSLDCIKHHLLDFGNSYWKSSLVKTEYPGLRSSNFASIGKYGIGFYSVFMVAKFVEIISIKSGKDKKKATKIEFPAGLTLSPIMSKSELATNISTIIRFQLNDNTSLRFNLGKYAGSVTIDKALQILVAGLDADVYFESENTCKRIHTNILAPDFDKEQWLNDLHINVSKRRANKLAKRLEWLKDENDNIKGLIAIPDGLSNKELMPFIETVKGLATSLNTYTINKGLVGYIDCKEEDISRNDIRMDNKTTKLLQNWLKDKYDNNYNRIVLSSNLSNSYQKAFLYSQIDTNEIVRCNEECIYSSYKAFGVKVGTIEGLKWIHILLFSGVTDFAGVYRVKPFEFRGSKKIISVDHLDSALMKIDNMPDGNYEEIISKFIKIVSVHPFTDGNGRSGRIWLNLLLKVRLGYMVDWDSIDRTQYYELLRNATEDEEPLQDYLRSFLKKI